jgi:predicted RNase H-like HicB family nuclease
MNAKLSMICTKQSNGSYLAVCPEVKGCFTQGDTYEEAFANLKELVKITIQEDLSVEEIQDITQSVEKMYSPFEIAVS